MDHDIDHQRSRLSEVNRSIAALDEEARPSRMRATQASLQALNHQIHNHDTTRPPDPVPPPPSAAAPGLEEGAVARIRQDLEALDEREAALADAYASKRARFDAAANLGRELDVLRSTFDEFTSRNGDLAGALGLTVDDLVELRIDRTGVDEELNSAGADLALIDDALAPDGEIATTRDRLEAELSAAEAELDAPRRLYEQQRRALAEWTAARNRLIGSPTQEDSQKYFEAIIADAASLPDRLAAMRAERLSVSNEIHRLLLEKVEMYRELYRPVQSFLDANQLARDKFSLEFEAQLEISEFSTSFLSFVDRGAVGSFYGVQASERRIHDRVRTVIPSEWDSVERFLDDHYLDLRHDRRSSATGSPLDSAADVLRKGAELGQLYDFLYGLSYLQAEYELRSDGRPISELSPGQKGTILLMFYLLVDTSGRPIALDQPDENLDNHTVHTLLRPAIRAAKSSRQVFVVTHSPNLAVVGDADQVIIATNDGAHFAYSAGSIENPDVRDCVLEVLEGTWPAFSNRERKYSTTAFPRDEGELE